MSTLAILKAEGEEKGLKLAYKIKALHDAGKTIEEISSELSLDLKRAKNIVQQLGLK